ncbi:glycoside hydrolase family protein [Cyanobacteria bacterium FACHB-63]|nr:glycoside hydrolase family protein [Cyanobacteria bacterium FACHB-63]
MDGMGVAYLPVQFFGSTSIISKADAERWLNVEVDEKAKSVTSLCKVEITQGMFDALVSFTFNLGAGALEGSTLLRKLNAKDYEGAAREFDRWIHGAGKVLPGLVIRRDKEEALFRRDGFPGDDVEIPASDNVASQDKPYVAPELPLKISRTLKEGSAGEDCYILNCALAELGFLATGDQPNRYSTATKGAVSWFQSKSSLKADGIFGPRTKAALAAAIAKSRKRQPDPMLDRAYCRLTRRHTTAHEGLESLLLEFISPQGNVLDSLRVVSGAPGAQKFRLPDDPKSFPGNLEPLPQARYTIADIDWAGGKDDYNTVHFHENNGIGPVFVPFIKTRPDDRGAFGFHVDWNYVVEGHSPGSAGCVCTTSIDDLKKLVRLLRLYDPRDIFVNWGLL